MSRTWKDTKKGRAKIACREGIVTSRELEDDPDQRVLLGGVSGDFKRARKKARRAKDRQDLIHGRDPRKWRKSDAWDWY